MISENKKRDPLGWPFGALPPALLAKLLREQKQDSLKKLPHAPL